MRKYYSAVFGFCLLIFGYVAQAESETATTDNFTDPAKSILVVQKDPMFTIKLQSNPTTGYSWFLKGYNPDFLELKKHQYVPPAENIPGKPGYEIWQFKVKSNAFVAPSITTVDLTYARAWDLQNDPVTTFNVVTH